MTTKDRENIVQPWDNSEALEAQFSDNSLTILKKRYLRKGPDGKPVEDVAGLFRRIAHTMAQVEADYGGDAVDVEDRFYRMLTTLRFVPNSPTFTGAGTPLGQLAACFVLPIEDDMGKTEGGIFQSLRDAALIQQTGGGNGFGFSRLRPQNSLVLSSMGKATGPLGFLRVFDKAFGEIAQGGTRRGANMAVLRVDHPDIEDFVVCKTSEDAITNFNISVGMVDGFMEAVAADGDWDLRFPDVEDPKYRSFSGTIEQAEEAGIRILTYKTIKARELYAKIAQQAWSNGEPGMLFLDTAQADNPLKNEGRYESTNPCGEQFLMPYENCCLGSLNLTRYLITGDDGLPAIDWDAMAESAELAVRFLDNVVDANAYVPAVPQLREAAVHARRIGLGLMGLADVLYHMNLRYGSLEAQQLSAQIMEFLRYHAMVSSIELATERGPFEAIKGSVYDPENITWQPKPWPAWLGDDPVGKWGRPDLDWEGVLQNIRKYGIRNSTQLTIAPTGTIATVAGVEGYGCEPVFALAYTRYVNDGDNRLELKYVSPSFQRKLDSMDLDEATKETIISKVQNSGSTQDVAELDAAVRDVFVVASDVTPEGHIRMQAALQLFTDASISKTINMPAGTSPDDVAEAFQLAWELGCKGLTVYVSGSRDVVVLETEATRKDKDAPEPAPETFIKRRPRPKMLKGTTYQSSTPMGTAYITINTNGHEQPFEVFLNVGKAGSDTAAVAEAIGRLISLTLRLPSPLEPRERLEQIVGQLEGIGGRRAMGFGHERVLSLPDGIAGVLKAYLDEEEQTGDEMLSFSLTPPVTKAAPAVMPIAKPMPKPEAEFVVAGDICPACGEAALVETEGCKRCYACGHSEC